MARLRHSTTRLWLALTAVLFSAVLSAPVAASGCVEPSAAGQSVTKASCEMAACCCGKNLTSGQSSTHVQPAGCECSLQQAPAPSDPAEASARAFTAAFGLPVAPPLVAVDTIRGPCLRSAEEHYPRAGATLRKPSRAPPVDRR